MTIKSDKWITKKAMSEQMISPFIAGSCATLPTGKKVPSYGLSSYGYDVRLGRNFKIFGNPRPVFNDDEHWKAYRTLEDGTYRTETVRAKDFLSESVIPEIDPCNFDENVVTEIDNVDELVMPPLSFCLGVAMERIKVPRDVSVVCMGKSTIARAGIIVIVTPLEAEWEGFITLEITNTTRMPVRLTTGMGITQLQFFQSDEQCEVSYADRNGKYQNQPPVAVTPQQL